MTKKKKSKLVYSRWFWTFVFLGWLILAVMFGIYSQRLYYFFVVSPISFLAVVTIWVFMSASKYHFGMNLGDDGLGGLVVGGLILSLAFHLVVGWFVGGLVGKGIEKKK